MKKFLLLITTGISVLILSCNNDKKDSGDTKNGNQQSLADSLEDEVMDGHDVGMAKYGKLKTMKQEAERMLDSISKLPAKAKEAMAPWREKLEGLVSDLNEAKEGMDNWMRNFDMDSAVNNLEERVRYLKEEKIKVGKVKESILQSLQKADSLLRRNL